MVVVELSTRSLQVAVVIQQVQPPQKLLSAAANELHEPFGTDEAMLGDMAENIDVSRRDLK